MFERGGLLLVPFPFTDLSTAKRRPVLAITSPDSYGDFIALPVTSRPHHANALILSNEDMLTGILPAASWVRIDRIVTLNSVLVLKVIGRTSDLFLANAIRQFCTYLDNDTRE